MFIDSHWLGQIVTWLRCCPSSETEGGASDGALDLSRSAPTLRLMPGVAAWTKSGVASLRTFQCGMGVFEL